MKKNTARHVRSPDSGSDRLAELLRGIATQLPPSGDPAFFPSLVQYLARTLGVAYAFAGERLPDAPDRVRTLAGCVDGKIVPNFEYALHGSPCEQVMDGKVCLYPTGVQALFPADTELVTMGAESYAGTPLFGPDGTPAGVLVILDRAPMQDVATVELLLQVLAVHAAGALARRGSEHRMSQLNRLLRTITGINQMIIRETSEERVLAETCRILVEEGGYRMAWIAFADLATGEVRPVAQAGFTGDYLSGVRIRCDDSPEGRGPTGTAIRTGRHLICEDIETDERLGPWRERARTLGYRSSAAFPLRLRDRVIGAINVYAEAPSAFGPDDVALLTELADDVGHGLRSLEDAAERRRVEEALRESERRLTTLMDNLPGAVYRCRNDDDWTVEFISEGCLALTGFRPAEFVENRRTYASVIHPEDRDGVWEQVQAALEARSPYQLVYRLVTASGETKWVWEQGQGVFAPDGSLLSLEGFIGDITERRLAEERLRASEERFRSLTELSSDWYWEQDDELRFTMITRNRETGERFPIEESLGKRRWELPYIDVSDAEWDRHKQALAARRPFRDLVLKRRDASGEVRYSSLSGVPLFDAAGRFLGYRGTGRDITERVVAEQALRESEQRLRTVLRSLPVILWATDANGVFTLSEGQGLVELGYAPGEVVGQSLFELYAEHPDVADAARRTLAGETVVAPARVAGRVYEANYVPVRGPEGAITGMIGVAYDVTARQQADDALRENERLLRLVLETLPVGVWIMDATGRIVHGNPAGHAIWAGARYVGIEEFGEYKGWWHDTGKPIAPHEWAATRAIQRGETSLNEIIDIECFDGTRKTILNSSVPLHDPGGAVRGAIIVNEDITERMQSDAEMHKLTSALQQTADAVIITNRDGVIEYTNSAFERTTGYARQEAIGRKPSLVKSGMHDADFYARMWRSILAGQVYRDVFVNRRKNGEIYYEEKTITPLKDAHGEITHFISTGKDITDRMEAQERLHYLAHHDALTGLPNRVLFLDRLHQALLRARRHEQLVGVMFLDLDRFKYINDTLGHHVGDAFLQSMATRLQACIRQGDTVARLGGDEFAVLLEEIAHAEDVSAVAGKILAAFAQSFDVRGHELFITASIGISLYPGDGTDAPTLLKNADAAMYRAKDLGKNNYQYYSADLGALAFERLTLETSLRRALEREEFVLHYQPQVELATGRIVGVEALVRWKHPDFGMLSPAQFIPVAEETGAIVALGEWVARAAMKQVREWRDAGMGPLRVAVNVSGRQFSEPGFIDTVKRLLAETGLDPSALELEITESAIMKNAEVTIERLRALHAMGVRFAIDDFGTGYSSLAYLRRFPIHALKIDKTFTRDLTEDSSDAEIVKTIIGMARGLNLVVVAEGVETREQLVFLRAHACHAVQGYLYSRPVPPERMAELLRQPDALKQF
ncbi:EAL domain-containing protein [Sulfurifustis variabilis]|uniref:bifunctional diguanylate cyclase/phosphodiesterase n=1 Tax=Sulfurifustis variabilis TaxID=1675686 RepID=UPI0011E4CD12|nr:EAL domain-containing protein [Sulfurifustis variabilis]